MAYTLVAISVLILRFSLEPDHVDLDLENNTEFQPLGGGEEIERTKSSNPKDVSLEYVFKQILYNRNKLEEPNSLSSQVATSLIVAISKCSSIFEYIDSNHFIFTQQHSY